MDEDQTFSLYGAATPNGKVIGLTVRQTPYEAWRVLRGCVTEPDDELIDRGWHIRRCAVVVQERLDD